jgi:septal ring factor EnvC (AmiA/AmiB activator)
MPKPAKTKIKLDSDSFQILLQEIYNDILSVQKKARSDMEERKGIPIASTTDAFQIGKVNNESLKIIDSSVDKKLALAKLQSQILTSSNETKETNQSGMTDDDKKLIRDLIEKQKNKNNVDYDVD